MNNDPEKSLQVRKKGSSIIKRILQGIRIFIGLALLYFALKNANWVDLKNAFQAADIRWLLIALALVLAGTVLKIWRWSLMLGNYGLSSSVFNVTRAYLVGQAANIMLPFRGGEVIRAGMLAQGNVVQISQVVSTIVIEKCLDLFSLTAVSLIVLPYLRLISNSSTVHGLILFSVLAMVLFAVFMLVSIKQWSIIRQRFTKSPQWITLIIEKLDQIITSSHWLQEWKRVFPVLGLTVWVWVSMWLINLPVFRSVNLPADPRLALFILVLVYVGLIPALTPGNIAPFYFFAQLGLVTFKIPAAEALAFAILLHAVVTLPILILGGILLLFQKKEKDSNWSAKQSL